MTNRNEVLTALREADLSNEDWLWNVQCKIQSQFAKGYLAHVAETLAESLPHHDEEFREKMIQAARYDIWK